MILIITFVMIEIIFNLSFLENFIIKIFVSKYKNFKKKINDNFIITT
jgi:hypothetical protein